MNSIELTIPEFFEIDTSEIDQNIPLIDIEEEIPISPTITSNAADSVIQTAGSATIWSQEESNLLYELMEKYPKSKDKVTRYAKIAHHFHSKSIRDVVFKMTQLSTPKKKSLSCSSSFQLMSFDEKESEALRQLRHNEETLKNIATSIKRSNCVNAADVEAFKDSYVTITTLMDLMISTTCSMSMPILPKTPDFKTKKKRRTLHS